MFERKNQTVMTKHYGELHADGNTAFKVDDDADDDEEIFDKKRRVDWNTTEIPTGQLPVYPLSFDLIEVVETEVENGYFEEGTFEERSERNEIEV